MYNQRTQIAAESTNRLSISRILLSISQSSLCQSLNHLTLNLSQLSLSLSISHHLAQHTHICPHSPSPSALLRFLYHHHAGHHTIAPPTAALPLARPAAVHHTYPPAAPPPMAPHSLNFFAPGDPFSRSRSPRTPSFQPRPTPTQAHAAQRTRHGRQQRKVQAGRRGATPGAIASRDVWAAASNRRR